MKNHIKSESIKERINHLLSTQATTKTALAHAIGMDVSQLSKLLNKQGTIPVDYIEPWAECLGIDVNELINSQQTISKDWVRPHAHIHLDIYRRAQDRLWDASVIRCCDQGAQYRVRQQGRKECRWRHWATS